MRIGIAGGRDSRNRRLRLELAFRFGSVDGSVNGASPSVAASIVVGPSTVAGKGADGDGFFESRRFGPSALDEPAVVVTGGDVFIAKLDGS